MMPKQERSLSQLSYLKSDTMRQRDTHKSEAYFRSYIESKEKAIAIQRQAATSVSDTNHLRQLWLAIYRDELELWIARYSAGEEITALTNIIDALDTYQQLPGSEPLNVHRLSDYIQSLWLISIAYLLNLDKKCFNDVVAVINLSGKDAILDWLIRLRIPEHPQAAIIIYPDAYIDLYNALSATGEEQNKWLHSFTVNYYERIKNVYWMEIDPETGNYFGRWLFELAAFVKADLLNDESIINNPHYPKDLV